MTTLTRNPAGPTSAGHPRGQGGPGRSRPRLGGTAWLVWRQHRAAFWTLIGLTALYALGMVFLRGQLTDYLTSVPQKSGGVTGAFEGHATRLFDGGTYLTYLPVLAGVFLGAPLVAGDLESGTAKLVTSQSVGRLRWLTTKLAMTAGLLVLCTAVLAAVFEWWWSPVRGRADTADSLAWTSGNIFDTTGIMPVAYVLLTFTVGVAVGMVLRRTLVSMVVTLGITVAIGVVWNHFRLSFGNIVSAGTHGGVGDDAPRPKLPLHAVQQGQGDYFLTGSGEHLDWTTCLDQMDSEKAHNACLASKHVVGYSVDYLPMSQMHTMQWMGAGVMLAATAAVVAFTVLWGRRRLL
ncbi:ABC transporter permease subunit [Streptomyces sp. NPDC059785]|uniref:ABC transporter permease subunit n=1 Tax=Streptomyces sp. NPDC059785 TaxID=3346945 RepID=UPI0036675B4C